MRKRGIFSKTGIILVFASVTIFLSIDQSFSQSKEPVILKTFVQSYPDTIEMARILSQDLRKLGIQLEIRTGTLDQWVGEIVKTENRYHLVLTNWSSSPERLEPSFFLTEFFHSSRAVPGGRNFGYYTNEEYDKIIDAQQIEMDIAKRQKLIRKGQEIIARDNVFFPILHKDYIQTYNVERIERESVVPTIGSCIGFPYSPWTFLKAKPKTDMREPRVVIIQDPIHTLNPFAVSQAQNEGWLRFAYETFAKRDQNANLIPWAAKSWHVVDNTTVDIVLRGGMKFHDGKPVTTEDVKFTFDYINKWKFPSFSPVWKNVESVKLMEGYRIRFKLYRPYSPFLENILMHAFIAPKHVWEKVPESAGVTNPMDWPNLNPIGSGAYQFVEWKKGEYFHLKANKNHWMPPNFDGLYGVFNPTIEGMMAMLEKGEAEILGWYLDGPQGKKLEAFSHLKMVTVPGHGMHEFRPNLKMKPTDDPMFRRAFQYTVNRTIMLDIVIGGYGTICHNTPITPLIKFWNNPNIPSIEFDLNKAKKILETAGYTWDEKGRLCYP